MKNHFLAFAIACSLGACNNNRTEQSANHGNDTISHDITSTLLKPCYVAVIGQDSVFLNLEKTEGDIVGKLLYKPLEKDKQEGTITGNIVDNVLRAEYKFQAEGLTSTRSIAFKIEENKLIEGIGEYEDREGNMVYKDPESLDFSGQSFIFLPSDCKSNK